MWEKFTDQQLVDMIRSKEIKAENRAVRYLMRRNCEKVIRWVKNRAGSREDGEEVFNDALSALCINIGSGSYCQFENAALETYLMVIVRNLWFKKLRKPGIRQPGISINECEAADVETERSVEMLLIEKEDNERFRRVFAICLNEKEKGILEAFYLEKMSMQEIADKFRLGNANNAKSTKYQIIKKLKKGLEDYGFWT